MMPLDTVSRCTIFIHPTTERQPPHMRRKKFALDYLKEFKDAYADDKRVSRFADTYRHPSALNPTNNATVSGITYSLSQFLKETYEEDVDTLSLPPFWNDLLRGALSEVNWMETASHIWEEWEERKERKQKEND